MNDNNAFARDDGVMIIMVYVMVLQRRRRVIRASFVATTRSVSRCAGSVMERMTVGTCLTRRIVVSGSLRQSVNNSYLSLVLLSYTESTGRCGIIQAKSKAITSDIHQLRRFALRFIQSLSSDTAVFCLNWA